MDIPYKQMFQWKTANLAPTLLGLWYLIVPWVFTQAINQTMAIFGFTFLSVGIIKAKPRPTVLASLFSALIGIGYVLTLMTTMPLEVLWMITLGLFALVLVFEFDVFKFGPTNAKAKVLTVVPLTLLGFCIVLGLAGYNPYITFNFADYPLVCLNYLAVMAFCWLYVLDYAGYKPFKARTNTWLNAMALIAVLLSLVGMYQGSLFQY